MLSYYQEYDIVKSDISNGGTVAGVIKRELRKRGIHPDIIKRVIIGIYEAEINVIIHSNGGKVTVAIDDNIADVTFEDIGPGIDCIETAMEEGFTTADDLAIENGFGAGMGLPNIKAVSDRMDIKSSPEGTILHLRFYLDGN